MAARRASATVSWKMLIAVSAANLLIACGGGSGEPPKLAASIEGCEHVAIYDDGHALYLIQDRHCPQSQLVTATLRFGTQAVPGESSTIQLGSDGVAQSLNILGLGERQVSAHWAGQWRKYVVENAWTRRDGAGLLRFNGFFYLLGGWAEVSPNVWRVTNEVWRSVDLSRWEKVTDQAPWLPRHGAGWLVHGGRMFVVGGDLIADVWSSSDGVSWRQESEDAAFGALYSPTVVSKDGFLLVYGGQYWTPYDWCGSSDICEVRSDPVVWASADGRSWRLWTEDAPWEPRGLVHGGAVYGGRVYLIGGGFKTELSELGRVETSKELSDIWSSSDGKDWRLEIEKFSFPARTHFSTIGTPYGCFVSDGSVGTQLNTSNDLFFAKDCVHYESIPDALPHDKRHASSLTYFNGSLIILGGPNYGEGKNAGTTVWQYFPSFD